MLFMPKRFTRSLSHLVRYHSIYHLLMEEPPQSLSLTPSPYRWGSRYPDSGSTFSFYLCVPPQCQCAVSNQNSLSIFRKFAPRCSVCKEPIMPAPGQEETVRIVALDRDFHVHCYRCEVWLTPLPCQSVAGIERLIQAGLYRCSNY